MEFTPHYKLKIEEIITTYNKFLEHGKEESLHAETIDIDNKEVIYGLIYYVGAYKSFDYEERANALENLTYHLITDTLIPVNYTNKNTKLTPLELTKLVGSPLLEEAITMRLVEEQKDYMSHSNYNYHKKHKR